MKKIKIIHNCIIVKNIVKNSYLFRLVLKSFQKFIFSLILSIYMPDVFISTYFNDPPNNDKEITFLIIGFLIFSTVLSYAMQNYQWKQPPADFHSVAESASNPNLTPLPDGNWRVILVRIWIAFWYS